MNNLDPIAARFFKLANTAVRELAANSDGILSIEAAPGDSPTAYVAEFKCRGLARDLRTGEIKTHDRWIVGVRFPSDYLRSVEPLQLVNILHPMGPLIAWHPNIHGPFLCPGNVTPGKPPVEIFWQIFEIITGNNYQTGNCLNPEAAEYIRNHPATFPVDRRPLARRKTATAVTEGGAP